jgi:outer membrane receptor protein involved in Fe transport
LIDSVARLASGIGDTLASGKEESLMPDRSRSRLSLVPQVHRTTCLETTITALLCLAVLGISLLACPAQAMQRAETGNIEGRVVRARDLQPVIGAQVMVKPRGPSATTDDQGRFMLRGVPLGAHSIDVTRPGFAPLTVEGVVVRSNQTNKLSIELEATAFHDEVVVTPSRYTLYREQPETRTSLSRKAISRMPHLADDVFRAFERLPGVTGEEVSARVNIRGGDIDETMVIVDGLELYEGFHLSDMFSIFGIVDAEAISGLDMMTGGFPVEYGNRMSGVIDITSSAPDGTGRTALSVGTVNLGVLSEGQFDGGRSHWLVSARRTFFDRIIEWIDPDSGFRPVFYDFLGKVSCQIGDRTVLAANVLGAQDDLAYVDTNEGGDMTEEILESTPKAAYVWLTLTTAWTSQLYSRSVLSHGQVDGARRGWVEYYWYDGEVHDNRRLSFVGLKQDWSLELRTQTVKWGFDLRRLEAEYDYLADAEVRDPLFTGGPPREIYREYDLAIDGNTYGAYVGDRFHLRDALMAEVGLRWDRQTYNDDDQVSPRVNLAYAFGNHSVLRAAWGHYYQPQYINELQVEDGITQFYPAQLAEHRLLSFEHAFSRNLDLRVEAYHKDLSDVRPHFENQLNPMEVFPEIEPDRIYVAPERAEAQGIEVTLTRIGRVWSWWLSYAYSKAEDLIEGEWVPRSWDQTHTFNASINYDWRHKWSFNLASIYHTGWPTTAIEPHVSTDENGWRYYWATMGPRNAERFEDYLRFDLRASRSFELRRSRLDLILDVINLLNRKNMGYVEDFGLQGTGGSEVEITLNRDSYLPIIPTLGIRWTF